MLDPQQHSAESAPARPSARLAAWPFGDLPELSYSTIIADPPWLFRLRSAKGEGKSAQRHYRCMPDEEIAGLPVARLARGDCLLLLWATFPKLDAARMVLDAWGFRYVTGGCWAKRSPTGRTWAFGGGYVLRSAVEPFLIGAIGYPNLHSRSERNLIVGRTRGHSRKPDQQYRLMENLGEPRRLELFARRPRRGWDSWGDQLGDAE